jgi:hypothetical protein
MIATLSTATIIATIVGSVLAYFITDQLIGRLERSDYIVEHDWVDEIEPFLMALPGVVIGLIIVLIGHAFVPSLETGIAFCITMMVGLVSGFIAAAPKTDA